MGMQKKDAPLPEKGLFPIGKEGWSNRNLCNINEEKREDLKLLICQ